LPEFCQNLKGINKISVIKELKRPKILISPLDWGLGHATRIIPIVQYLQQLRCQIWFAGSGTAEKVLKETFPDILFLKIDGYAIDYPGNKRSFSLKIIPQIPKILHAIFTENKWLKINQEIYHWDAVISDNRFGLFHKNLHSVFITHQVNIRTGMGIWADKLIRQCNLFFIHKYDHCWIPDAEGNINLAGELSHGSLPGNARYIGPISRFTHHSVKPSAFLLILLSGPEPQRSILENIIEKQLSGYTGQVILVRGLPAEKEKPADSAHIQRYNHLPANGLQDLLEQAGLVICRSGYTTVMDLVRLQKKALLVPTPGQAEQEYLATYLEDQNIFPGISQDDFDLQKALQKAGTFRFRLPSLSFELYREVIGQFVLEKAKERKPCK
jgi:UDP-N-acetylglucosamine transferase subunit ALG13